MSKDLKNLAPPASKEGGSKNRKMTQAILEDQEKEKEVYEFLEEDDDFEEFENDEIDYDQVLGGDVEMGGSSPTKLSKNKNLGEDIDRKLW